ncbi:MAG: DUF6273 domain-containing protein [Acholeplasma sp.]
MRVGQIITFGNYKWKVLNIKDTKALIITLDIVKQMPYHNRHEAVIWLNSSLRDYLNNTFYNEFSDHEKARIITTTNHNSGNLWYNPGPEPDSEDKVFILSLEEMVGPYFNDSMQLLINKGKNQRYWFERRDDNNSFRKSSYLGYVWWYWVRTGGRLKTSTVYIHGDGNIGIQGNKASKKNYNTLHPITQSNEGGVRPALWLEIDYNQ